MNPIINPIWFYLIDCVDALQTIMIFVFSFSLIAIIVLAVVLGVNASSDGFEGEKGEQLKGTISAWLKRVIVFMIISGVLMAALPSSKTSYKMLAASLVTPNNIQAVVDTGKDLVDYIVESVEKIQDNDKPESDAK